jgi:uncharacterized LabA/DUF88 family protein
MCVAPTIKRTVAFFDGQNLYHHARDAFGYAYPNYSPLALASRICRDAGLNLHQIRFYTGVPSPADSPFWNGFWAAKLLAMSRAGIVTFSRPLRYRQKTDKLAGNIEYSRLVGEEKGIDIRIALDVMRMARRNELDVALIFSQNQDFSEVADEIKSLVREQGRWIKLISAFPISATSSNRRGINKTDWITIERATYEACIDTRDYRPKKGPKQ